MKPQARRLDRPTSLVATSSAGHIMARFKWWHAVLFLAVFVAFVVSLAPADWFGAAVERATDGRVRVLSASGFPWRGRGDLVVRADGSEIVLREIRWRWLPGALVSGDLAIELELATGGSAVIAQRVNETVIRKADFALPAAVLAEGIPDLRGWQPSGVLSFRTQGLAFDGNRLAGDAELIWRGAGAAGALLGDYRFLVHGRGASAAQLQLVTLRGPLHLEGSGELGPGGALRLRGTAQPNAESRAQLGPLLALFGANPGNAPMHFELTLPRKGSA